METEITKEPELLINDAHGVYIPQLFCQAYTNYIVNKNELQEHIQTCLEGPEGEFYWDSWDMIESNCKFTNDNNESYYIGYLGESGDLWAIPEDYIYPED